MSPTLHMLSLLSSSRILRFQPFLSSSPCCLPSPSPSLPWPLVHRIHSSHLNISPSNKQDCSESLLLFPCVHLFLLLSHPLYLHHIVVYTQCSFPPTRLHFLSLYIMKPLLQGHGQCHPAHDCHLCGSISHLAYRHCPVSCLLRSPQLLHSFLSPLLSELSPYHSSPIALHSSSHSL